MSNLQTVPVASKYGLVKRQGELSGPALVKHRQQQGRFGMAMGGRGGSAIRARPPPKSGGMGGIFRADDSDNELDEAEGTRGQSEIAAVNRDLTRAAVATASKQAALSAADDASFYDYDGQYDSFKKTAGDSLGSHALNQGSGVPALKSRYVNSLKATAAVREKE